MRLFNCQLWSIPFFFWPLGLDIASSLAFWMLYLGVACFISGVMAGSALSALSTMYFSSLVIVASAALLNLRITLIIAVLSWSVNSTSLYVPLFKPQGCLRTDHFTLLLGLIGATISFIQEKHIQRIKEDSARIKNQKMELIQTSKSCSSR